MVCRLKVGFPSCCKELSPADLGCSGTRRRSDESPHVPLVDHDPQDLLGVTIVFPAYDRLGGDLSLVIDFDNLHGVGGEMARWACEQGPEVFVVAPVQKVVSKHP